MNQVGGGRGSGGNKVTKSSQVLLFQKEIEIPRQPSPSGTVLVGFWDRSSLGSLAWPGRHIAQAALEFIVKFCLLDLIHQTVSCVQCHKRRKTVYVESLGLTASSRPLQMWGRSVTRHFSQSVPSCRLLVKKGLCGVPTMSSMWSRIPILLYQILDLKSSYFVPF